MENMRRPEDPIWYCMYVLCEIYTGCFYWGHHRYSNPKAVPLYLLPWLHFALVLPLTKGHVSNVATISGQTELSYTSDNNVYIAAWTQLPPVHHHLFYTLESLPNYGMGYILNSFNTISPKKPRRKREVLKTVHPPPTHTHTYDWLKLMHCWYN